MLKALREKKSEEMRRYRSKIKERKLMLESTDTPAKDETSPKAFASKRSYGKEVAKVKRNLPFSPSKCRAVVRTLARQITPDIITPKHKKPKKTISADTVEKVQNFYVRDDISCQNPGIKDTTIVRLEDRKKLKCKKQAFIPQCSRNIIMLFFFVFFL